MKPTPPAGKKFMGRKPPWKEVTAGEAVVRADPRGERKVCMAASMCGYGGKEKGNQGAPKEA